jgi:hypothetical protein
MQGHADEAERFFLESLALARSMGYTITEALTLAQLGAAAGTRGDLAAARAYSRAGLLAAYEAGDRRLMAVTLEFFADVEIQDKRYEQGVTFKAAQSAWHDALIGRRSLAVPGVSIALALDDARIKLGAEGFARAWEAGQRMTLEQATAEALRQSTSDTRSGTTSRWDV